MWYSVGTRKKWQNKCFDKKIRALKIYDMKRNTHRAILLACSLRSVPTIDMRAAHTLRTVTKQQQR